MLLAGLSGHAQAADVGEPSGDWVFTVAPYLWGTGLSGDVGVPGHTANVDIGFSDILKNLKFAAMGAAEAHNGTWGVFSDVMYVHIAANASAGNGTIEGSIDTTSFAGTLMGEYRVVSSDELTVDLMGGARVWSVDNDLSVSLAGWTKQKSIGDTWVDPMVGFKTKINTGSPLYVTAWGLIGGAGVGSDLTWDVMAGVGYQWTDSFSTVLSYRAVGVDYSNNDFVYDVVQQGPALGAVFSF